LRSLSWTKTYKRRSVGNCIFYGPEPFLNKCECSLLRLHEIDEDIFLSITAIDRLTFIYTKVNFDESTVSFYTISDDFLSWGDHRIITRLVHASMKDKMLGKYVLLMRNADLESRMNNFNRRMADWLDANGFPGEIIRPYRLVT
jgi:hypothetical protein